MNRHNETICETVIVLSQNHYWQFNSNLNLPSARLLKHLSEEYCISLYQPMPHISHHNPPFNSHHQIAVTTSPNHRNRSAFLGSVPLFIHQANTPPITANNNGKMYQSLETCPTPKGNVLGVSETPLTEESVSSSSVPQKLQTFEPPEI